MKKLWLDDILESQRCILRIPKESEVEEMWNLISDETTQYVNWSKWPDSSWMLENIKNRRQESLVWTSWQAWIYLKDDNILIWSIGFQWLKEDIQSSEIWYWLSEKYWKQWYMTECLEKLIETSFTKLGWNSLIIRTDIPNISSRKLAESCWFLLDGTLRNNSITRWKIVDVTHYSILKKDYLSKNKLWKY